MRLLKRVDVQFTKKNVYDVLESYRSYVRMAGAEYLPKITTTYSFEPKTFTGKNTATENMVIDHVDAEAEVLEIERAVNCIMDPYVRQVIAKKYMDMEIQLSDKTIYMDLGYSESEFYRMLSRGALEFAEAYRKGKLIVFRKILGDICK